MILARVPIVAYHVTGNCSKFCLWYVLSFFDLTRLSTEARTKIAEFVFEDKSVVPTQRKFKAYFKDIEAPSTQTISKITGKFLAHGTVLDHFQYYYTHRRPLFGVQLVAIAHRGSLAHFFSRTQTVLP